jgi:hypothetical protein
LAVRNRTVAQLPRTVDNTIHLARLGTYLLCDSDLPYVNLLRFLSTSDVVVVNNRETPNVTGRIDTGRAIRNREYQLDETRLDEEQIVNLSITYCKTIVN